MGIYSNLYVDNELIGSEKGEVDANLVSLFDLADYFSLPVKEGEKGPFGYAEEHSLIDGGIKVHYLTSPSFKIKDRLNSLGYTKKFMRECFESEIQNLRERISVIHEVDSLELKRRFVEQLNFEKFTQYLQGGQLENYLNDYELAQLCGGNFCGLLAIYLLDDDTEKTIAYDLTDIIHGYYEDLVDTNGDGAELYNFFTENYVVPFRYRLREKIIVLTEGPTDCEYLSRTLKLLYPHLDRYYSFLDYRLFKIPSGAGNLANSVKAFVGVGLSNRVIAIFDNDVAGQSAMNSLKLKLPDNFRVLQYPSLELLENYPAIGPLGEDHVNVNGYAGSIELYMGLDALTKEDGSLEPVRWGGYDVKTGKYQASIIAKDQVQKRYKHILKFCENNENDMSKYDFSGMNLILQRIFNIFNEE